MIPPSRARTRTVITFDNLFSPKPTGPLPFRLRRLHVVRERNFVSIPGLAFDTPPLGSPCHCPWLHHIGRRAFHGITRDALDKRENNMMNSRPLSIETPRFGLSDPLRPQQGRRP